MADNKALIRRYFQEVLSKGDIKVVDEVLAPDVVVQTPSYMAEPLRGREAVKQWFSDLRRAFPDLQFTLGEEVAEGDRVASSFRLTGTHRQDYMGLPATGRKISLTGVDLFRISSGKIAEVRIYYDTLGLMQQLGVVPAPGKPQG